MNRFDRDGFRWECQDGFAPVLAALWASQGEVIKSFPQRRITRHVLDGRVYYIKRYLFLASAWTATKHFFRAPKSRLEWRAASELEKRGIPVVPHCAHGERWTARGMLESALITEGCPGNDLRSIPGQDTEHAQRQLGEFVGRLHAAGVCHGDLHIANLLFDPSSASFCLVDVANVQFKTAVSLEERVQHLARLNSRFELRAPFYEAYGHPERDLPGKVARATELRNAASVRHRINVCLRPNLRFTRRKAGGLTWHVRAQHLSTALERILGDPDRFLNEQARLYKDGGSAKVGGKDGLVLKRSHLRKRRNIVFDLFRMSRSRRAFRLAYHLELLSIPAPRPVAVADRRRNGLPFQSYLIMTEVPGAAPAYAWCGSMIEAARASGHLIGRLHESGFSHRDLKDSNLVFDQSGAPFLLDMDGIRYLRQVSDRRAARDIARLARALFANQKRLRNTARAFDLSRSTRARFLTCYCQTRGRTDWKAWWRTIEGQLSKTNA